jgi:hypothetical protein
MVAEIYKDDINAWHIQNIRGNKNPNNIKTVVVEPSTPNKLWIVVETRTADRAYGWINIDDAEAIGLAILDVVAQTRKREAK